MGKDWPKHYAILQELSKVKFLVTLEDIQQSIKLDLSRLLPYEEGQTHNMQEGFLAASIGKVSKFWLLIKTG